MTVSRTPELLAPRKERIATMRHENTLITDIDHRRLQSCLRQAASNTELDTRGLSSLHNRLRSADVVESTDMPANVVTMNSLVVLRNLDSGDRLTCRLTYPYEAGQSPRNVSVSRPLGTAILGARVGQVIRWPGGTRDRRMRIQQVLYQPEAAGDFHL
jgi:regulator of nucleoside diphosphate kinase